MNIKAERLSRNSCSSACLDAANTPLAGSDLDTGAKATTIFATVGKATEPATVGLDPAVTATVGLEHHSQLQWA